MERDRLFLFEGVSPKDKARCWEINSGEEASFTKSAVIYDSEHAKRALALVLAGSVLVRHGRVVMNELHAVKRERDAAESKLAAAKLNDLLGSAVEVGSLKLAVAVMDGSDSAAIRTMADNVKSTIPEGTVVLLVGKTDALSFACICAADAVKAGAHAGKLIKAVTALCGGNGGGRPDSAMGAGKDLAKLGEVAAVAASELKAML